VFPYPCFPEIEPMTLQIAMIGKDGIVIASDTKASSAANWRQIPSGTQRTITRTFKGPKILISPTNSLVCLFSGSDAAALLAQTMVANAPREFANDREVSDYLTKQTSKNMTNELIIAAIPKALAGVHKLWRVSFLSEPVPLVGVVEDKLYGGDESIASVFYGERYYDASRTVDELILLAAHVILEGHHLFSSIDGLTVLTIKDGEEPKFIDNAELDLLRCRSAAIYNRVRDDLFNGRSNL
jgi:hypothetical protein